MKGILTLKKSAMIAAVCMAVLCVLGCNKLTPEQVAERKQEKALKGGEAMIDKFLHNGKYVKVYGDEITYVSLVQISSIEVTENSFAINYDYGLNPHTWRFYVDENHISLDKDCNIIVGSEVKPKTKKEIESALKKEQLEKRTKLLFSAVKSNNLEQAKVCIELGADVNAKSKDDNGETALMIATNKGNKDMVDLLIKSGVNVNATDNIGSTALMYAAWHNWIDGNYKDITELLVN
ncbi:MAG: ankyrin repeat domain-containing protein [Treponemataceae bacterium]|nr:ankyrin repeat domain-containing protein [Treponemataceae bacterium]